MALKVPVTFIYLITFAVLPINNLQLFQEGIVAKKKKKKQKKPNIPVQAIARSRLDQIFSRYFQEELDGEECVGSIQTLMGELGPEVVLTTMVGMLDNSSNDQKDALMTFIPKLGNEQTVKHLWHLVRRSKMSVGAKMTALVILKQMGEDVNMEDPGKYFSWRDIKQADATEVAGMGRFSMQALIKELQRLNNIDDVEAMMLQFGDISAKGGGDTMVLVMVDELVAMGDSGAAEMLLAMSATTQSPKVRKAARNGLLKLSGKKVFPQSELIKSLGQERFHSAYCSDPAHPWQQQIAILFERGGRDQVQALTFLLDFGHPWNGAIKDMFPTETVPISKFKREFIDRAKAHGVEMRQVPYARVRQMVIDALEATRKSKTKQPQDLIDYRHWVERRLVDPSPETLAYARQVDARSVDEWGELTEPPVRGMQFITGADGEKMPVVVLGDLDDLDEDEWEEVEFADLREEVDEYYYSETDDEDEDDEEEEEFPIPYDWVMLYLTDGYDKGLDVEELDDCWQDLCDFMFYLTEDNEAPTDLTKVQGYHLSQFVTEFWEHEIVEDDLAESKRHAVETVRDLYNFLSKRKFIPRASAKQISKAAAKILRYPDKLTPIEE